MARKKRLKVGDKVKVISDSFEMLKPFHFVGQVFEIIKRDPDGIGWIIKLPNGEGAYDDSEAFMYSYELELANSELIRKKLGIK